MTYESKHRRVTYLGARAEVWTFARTPSGTKGTGERVVAMRWLDDAKGQPVEHPAGTLVLTHCQGDGRSPNYQSFDVVPVVNGSDEDARIIARHALEAAS